MAHESLLAFLEKASQDPALQEQLNGAVDAEAVASFAHSAGCTDVTAEQVSAFLAEVDSQQQANADQELEGVTGGLSKGWKIGLEATGGALATGALLYGVYKLNQMIFPNDANADGFSATPMNDQGNDLPDFVNPREDYRGSGDLPNSPRFSIDNQSRRTV